MVEKCTLDEFCNMLTYSIDEFQENMKKQGYTEQNTDTEWMEMFLRWMEWQTDVHEWYWESK